MMHVTDFLVEQLLDWKQMITCVNTNKSYLWYGLYGHSQHKIYFGTWLSQTMTKIWNIWKKNVIYFPTFWISMYFWYNRRRDAEMFIYWKTIICLSIRKISFTNKIKRPMKNYFNWVIRKNNLNSLWEAHWIYFISTNENFEANWDEFNLSDNW